jgi:hypothetical protein
MAKSTRKRLAIDFESKEKLAEFVASLRCHSLLPADAAVYQCDALDVKKDMGVTTGNTYVVRREGSRPDSMRLKVSTKHSV